MQPGDIVNVPIGIYRGFRNAGDDPEATLIALVGGPDPGKVDWHPSVLEAARRTGLSVDDEGRLIVAAAAVSQNASAAAAWAATWRDGPQHISPNAGYPEAAMAGALGLTVS